MDTKLRVQKYILEKKLIEPGDLVLVGLSGGADSVCLLAILSDLRRKLGFSLSALHVHHGIRGEEADRDLEFSKAIAARLDVEFDSSFVNAPLYAAEKSLGLEEAARILRYRAFREKLDGLSCEGKKWIAVAHHQDDQAETVLHHLIRGSGLRGLGGMDAKREEIIRPLLSVSREEILAELKKRNLPYIVDSSNEDLHYTRNRLRKEILPELEGVNRQAVKHIALLADRMREADQVFENEAKAFVESFSSFHDFQGDAESEVLREIRIPVRKLKEKPELVQSYIVREAVSRLNTPLKDWEAGHFRDIAALIHKAGNAHIDLPYRMSAEHKKQELLLRVNREVISMKRKNTKEKKHE